MPEIKFFYWYSGRVSEILQKLSGCFYDTSGIISSQWNMSLVSNLWVIWRKVIHTRRAPVFWGLHKKMNCAFPLNQPRSFLSERGTTESL